MVISNRRGGRAHSQKKGTTAGNLGSLGQVGRDRSRVEKDLRGQASSHRSFIFAQVLLSGEQFAEVCVVCRFSVLKLEMYQPSVRF